MHLLEVRFWKKTNYPALHFLYSIGPHPVSSLHIYTFVVWVRLAKQETQTPPRHLVSPLQGSVNVHHCDLIVGATVTVHQFFCILLIGSIFCFVDSPRSLQTLQKPTLSWLTMTCPSTTSFLDDISQARPKEFWNKKSHWKNTMKCSKVRTV